MTASPLRSTPVAASRPAAVPFNSGERYVLKDFRGSSHRTLAQWVGELPPGSRVLELGPGTAHVARLAGRVDLEWHGLDSSVDCMEALCTTLTGGAIVDLESIPRLPAGYQAVLAADSLEHLADPARMLAMIREALPPGAPLLISVPNIANLYVRLNLLIGRLPYSDRGLLDRSHRVFFTRRWLHQLLGEAGLVIERESVSTVPLPLVFPRLGRGVLDVLLRLLAMMTALAPTLLGYQLMVVAKRR